MLAELSFEEVAGGATLVLSDGVVSSGGGVTLLSGFSGSAEVPGCDTDCAGLGVRGGGYMLTRRNWITA